MLDRDVLREIAKDGRAYLPAQTDDDHALAIVTLDEFVSVDEPGADPILGPPGQVVIPEGGDVMLYGDGGASKTTLGIDLAFHLAAGDDWLGLQVPKRCQVLLLEAEGPRPLYRKKLLAKRDTWQGSHLGDRVRVYETPWANFRFPNAGEVADLIGELEVDVLIVGPLTNIGMEELGTLQQVRDFMAEVAKFRARSGRRLTVVLVHHENKGGKVSGAWEGSGETLLHATVHVRGKTTLHFQKTRWASQWHKQTLELEWTDGEGFQPTEEPDRDLLSEIKSWLLAHPYSTYKEIATKREYKHAPGATEIVPGIGAREGDVRDVLEANQDIFKVRKGEEAKEVGRHPSAEPWEVREGAPTPPAHPGAPAPSAGGVGAGVEVRPPVRGAPPPGAPPATPPSFAQTPGAPLAAATPEQEALAERFLDKYRHHEETR